MFLEAKYTGKVDPSKIKADKLPNKVGLITTVQFVDYLDKISSYLQKKGKKVAIGKAKQKYPGQILGCDAGSALKVKGNVDAYLYIGTGKFHPLIVGVSTDKDVFTFNPIAGKFKKLENKEIESYKKRKKAALIKFLHADTVGILVSTKKGQYYDIKKLTKLENKYPKKKFYTFITETIDYNQLENFPFIQAWVNTACPRIEEDIRIVNIEEIK